MYWILSYEAILYPTRARGIVKYIIMKVFDWEYNILRGLIMRKKGKNTSIKVGISSGFCVSNRVQRKLFHCLSKITLMLTCT